MNTIFYTLSVTWKEIQLMLKERGSLAIMVLLPLLLSTMMGSINIMANSGEEASILLHVCMVNEDSDGAFGIEVSKAIESIEELEIETCETAIEAEERVSKGQVTAAILIPANFSEDITTHTPTTIDVIVDPGEPDGASIVSGMMNQVVTEVTIWGEVQYGIRSLLDESGALAEASPEQSRAVEAQTLGVIMTSLNEMRTDPVIAVISDDLEGAQNEGWIELFFALMFPGLTVMFMFFSVSWLAPSLLKEREAGTLRRLLAAPIPRGAVIAGKMLAFMLLGCLQVVILFSIAHVFYNMPLGESPVALIILTLVTAFVSTALGVMVAALAKSSAQADSVGMILGFILGGLSGCIGAKVPATRAGGMISLLANLTPHGHALEAYYRLLAENGTFMDILPRMGILLGMGIVFYLIAVRRFQFE